MPYCGHKTLPQSTITTIYFCWDIMILPAAFALAVNQFYQSGAAAYCRIVKPDGTAASTTNAPAVFYNAGGFDAIVWSLTLTAAETSVLGGGIIAFGDAASTQCWIEFDVVAASGGGDPLASAVPGSYSPGQAGYVLGTNLDTTVSSRSTYSGGAVASVTGGVGGSVAGSVASVSGNVGGNLIGNVNGNVNGNVVGSVGSVAGAVGSVAGVSFPANFGSLTISSAGRVAIQSAVITNNGIAAFPFIMFSSADHVTPVSGLTVSAQRSIDGGAFAACAHSPVSVGNGDYVIQLASTDVNGAWIVLIFTAIGADPTFAVLGTTP